MTTPYLIQVGLDSLGLTRLARKRGLVGVDDDLGYLAHTVMREVWGGHAPQPFSLRPGRGRWISVLGYGCHDAAELSRIGGETSLPQVHGLLDWRGMRSKPLPPIPSGRRLGFELRACPVRRRGRGAGSAAGSEMDAFLVEAVRSGPDARVDRDAVYRSWITEQLSARQAARVEWVRVVRFELGFLARRDAGRKARRVTRPDVTFAGALEVCDADEFGRLLTRGVGRHRAFGFGMLLLRPPERC